MIGRSSLLANGGSLAGNVPPGPEPVVTEVFFLAPDRLHVPHVLRDRMPVRAIPDWFRR